MIKKLLIISVLLLANSMLLSCTSDKDMKDTVKGETIKLSYMDTEVKAGDDFFSYANGSWVKNTKMPGGTPTYDTLNLVYDEAQDNMLGLIKSAAKSDNPKGSDKQLIGDLYTSFMDHEQRNKLGLTPIANELKKIDNINSYDDLSQYFGYANQLDVALPFLTIVSEDFIDPTKYIAHTWQYGNTLPIDSDYTENSARSIKLRKALVTLIDSLLSMAGKDNAKALAQKVFNLESKLVKVKLPRDEVTDFNKHYNSVPVGELNKIMPHFNWPLYLKEAKFDQLKNLVIMQTDYLKKLDQIMIDTPLGDWKAYLSFKMIYANSKYLSDDAYNAYFDFLGREVFGMKNKKDNWRIAIDGLNDFIGPVLGKAYVKAYFSEDIKQNIIEMTKNIVDAYRSEIKNNTWLAQSTKEEALKKLDTLNLQIGYPPKWEDYSGLTIKPDDLFNNIRNLRLFMYDIFYAKKTNTTVNKNDWQIAPQEVNGMYNTSTNSILLTAAILQKPLYDKNANNAYNYGAIGTTIGHELGHAFDKTSSDFNSKGELKNWWTDKDKTIFDGYVKKIIKQYSEFTIDGQHVKGEISVDENLGDLNGFYAAFEAYKNLNEPEKIINGFNNEQRFFISYAQAFASLDTKDGLIDSLSRSHTANIFRVNGVVRNIPEFYTLFNVKKGDKLYLPPEERVKIW